MAVDAHVDGWALPTSQTLNNVRWNLDARGALNFMTRAYRCVAR
jgi:hypothetical protein